MSVFLPNGQLIRSTPSFVFASTPPGEQYAADGSLASVDDAIGNRTFLEGRHYAGLHQDTAQLLFYPRFDKSADSVAQIPSQWVWVVDQGYNSIIYAGDALLARDLQRLVTGHGDRFIIDVRTTSGHVLNSIRVNTPRVRLSSVEKSFVFDSVRKKRTQTTDFDLSNLRFAEYLPAIEKLKVDGRGCIWARTWDDPATTANRWIIFDANRGPVAQMIIPKSMFVNEIGVDYLLGFALDADDVQSVVLSHFERTVVCDQ